MHVITIDIPELGNRSYIVHDGHEAIVVDPSRRIGQVVNMAKEAGVVIRAVFETHIHNDYITGGYALSQELAVPYYISDHDAVTFAHENIAPEQTVTVGLLKVTAIAAPGHTHSHTGYLVSQDNTTPCFFSGGSLLYGAVGRTDLVSEEDTTPLARAQYQTAQYLIDRLDAETRLYPTHGFGSFCAAAQTEDVVVSTLAQQHKTNPAYTASDERSFVRALLDGLDVYPAYYAYMAPANVNGPLNPMLDEPAHLTRETVLRALHDGAAIIDMRSRTAYAARYLPGTYNIESSNELATYAGWLIAWETPLILVAATAAEIATAQEQLTLIGRDAVDGQIAPPALLSDVLQVNTYPVRTFAELPEVLQGASPIILDVRRQLEWEKAHVRDAKHIPLHELRGRLHELPQDAAVWVYCGSGFRAAIAASILAGDGRAVTLVNDNFDNALRVGLVPIKKQPFVDEVINHAAQLVDVRDASEWATEHARDAVHLPLGRLLEGDTEPLDIGKPVYVYCETGERSGMAENYLQDLGFEAKNIGGLNDWIQAGGVSE